MMFGSKSDSGIDVNSESAITHTPLWHGLTLLGGDAGSLPLQMKRRDGENTVNVTDHEAYELSAIRPHELMCPCTFWEAMVITAVLHGNAIAEIKRSGNGRALPVSRGGGLDILPPASTRPWFDESGKLWIESFVVHPATKERERRLIDPDDVFHLPSLSMDGFWGRGVIDVGKNRIGNGLGMEKQANKFMRNGMQPSWLFSYPINLDPEEGIAIEDRLRLHNSGLDNVGRNLVLDNDVKAEQLGMSMEHAQFVDLAKLDVQMVSSLLGIPAVMLNAMDKMTFSNAEESERWYINRTLRRWLNKIVQELATKLLSDMAFSGAHGRLCKSDCKQDFQPKRSARPRGLQSLSRWRHVRESEHHTRRPGRYRGRDNRRRSESRSDAPEASSTARRSRSLGRMPARKERH
jgi:HK97 family phage portal protein